MFVRLGLDRRGAAMPSRIEDYAVIADTQTAALVSRDGSIDWLCLPRFDSGACFAALLGDERNGHWRIAPAGNVKRVQRRYRGDTLVLETEFETDEGVVRLVDFMVPRLEDPDVVRKDWREWLLRAMAGDPPALQIMYGPAGEARLPELELEWLPGYEDSKPVRTGNAAVEQFQLDVYGEVMDALHKARQLDIEAHPSAWALQRALLEFLEANWQRPDEGIWEVRGPRRHFTHSKVLAWVAMDRAVKAVEQLGHEGPVDRWRRIRHEIHQEVCRNAYDPDRRTFTQFYGSRELDASLLLMPLVGFLPPSDPRVRGTIEAIERELCQDGFVLRYPTGPAGEAVDGLPGREGAFLACTFWLADNYALVGRPDDARSLFRRLLDLRNDVGLLAEEYDPVAGRQLGNFPQAFSHVPLINTAMHLSEAGPDPRYLRFENESEDAAR
jgi:GH15 family glucan-1,4-alpha-glucosidase